MLLHLLLPKFAISEFSISISAHVSTALSAALIATVFACAMMLTAALAIMPTTSTLVITTSCSNVIAAAAGVPATFDTIFAVAALDSSRPKNSHLLLTLIVW
jgi:hypothetical protein